MHRSPSPAAMALLLLGLVASAAAVERIAVTELMRDPAGREDAIAGGKSHEYVEIANLGSTDFSLDSIFFSNGMDIDSVLPWDAPIAAHPGCIYGARTLHPGQVAVLIDSDYVAAIQSSPSSKYTIADSTVLLTMDDDDIGDADGMAGDDGVFFYKGSRSAIGRVIAAAVDSGQRLSTARAKLRLSAPAGAAEGASVVLRSFLFGAAQYGPCPSRTSLGTVEALQGAWVVEWRLGRVNEVAGAVECSVAALRTGTAGVAGARCVVEHGGRGDTLVSLRVTEADSAVVRLTVDIPLDTVANAIVVSEAGTQTRLPVDISSVWTPSASIRITEVHPRATSAEPEWFEITNVSAIPIDVKDWRYGTAESNDTLAAWSLLLKPGAFAVFTSDTAALARVYPVVDVLRKPPHWHAMDNYRDTLCLWNSHGALVETVRYDYTWFGAWAAQSLERVSVSVDGAQPSAWVVSSRASPGQPNPAETWRSVSAPSVEIGPVPFTPNGDGRDDLLSIRMAVPAAVNAALAVYGFDGTVVRDFGAGVAPQVLWDGRRQNGQPAPVGPFFVVVQLKGTSGTTVIRKKGVLWR